MDVDKIPAIPEEARLWQLSRPGCTVAIRQSGASYVATIGSQLVLTLAESPMLPTPTWAFFGALAEFDKKHSDQEQERMVALHLNRELCLALEDVDHARSKYCKLLPMLELAKPPTRWRMDIFCSTTGELIEQMESVDPNQLVAAAKTSTVCGEDAVSVNEWCAQWLEDHKELRLRETFAKGHPPCNFRAELIKDGVVLASYTHPAFALPALYQAIHAYEGRDAFAP